MKLNLLRHRMLPCVAFHFCALGLLCVPAFAQHDAQHRLVDRGNAMRLIARGGAELDESLQQLTQHENDPESLYLLMTASSARNEPAKALSYAKKAVAAGLPFERILAGPRLELTALHASPEFKAWAQTHPVTLLHGPMLGAVTDTSARFWMRTAHEARVSVEIMRAEATGTPSVIRSEPASTSADEDYTATVEVTGLSPDTAYRYHVLLGDKRVGEPAVFRTYPRAGASARFTVAFGGGARVIPENERVWSTLAARKPRALLLLGDNVYIDDPTHPSTQLYCYYRRQSQPEWRHLVASTGVYAIYDDHDFGTNDCVPGPDVEHPAWKRKAWEVFKQNWNNPAYGGGQTAPGCWFDFHLGDVHFILLDGRYYRDLKGKSMLGPIQKAWLLETLKNSTSTFTVLASDVPWSVGVKPGSRDTWDGFPEEREEIFSFIEQQKIEGVLLLSADRHRSDFLRIERPNGYDFYEFQSSRLTNRHTHPIIKSPGHLLGYNRECSFGLLQFDTTRPDPQVKLSIVNIDGETIHAMQVTHSQLSQKSHPRRTAARSKSNATETGHRRVPVIIEATKKASKPPGKRSHDGS